MCYKTICQTRTHFQVQMASQMEPQKPQHVFPNEIWELIFSCLGDASTQTLLACRETCRDFQYWTDTFTQLWSRMSLVRAVQDNNISLCRKIILCGHNSNPAEDKLFEVTPLHERALSFERSNTHYMMIYDEYV